MKGEFYVDIDTHAYITDTYIQAIKIHTHAAKYIYIYIYIYIYKHHIHVYYYWKYICYPAISDIDLTDLQVFRIMLICFLNIFLKRHL